ncbi:CsoS2 family carboxysome shell protein [Nitrosomonas sp.]|uniref:CsoS2 family carboxysome shell protein n=1 Tax=Nitrosomonas sp. TaxID=42353 RepID=UPI0025F0B637|nr:CsoS2 family carboxysome shell protein [Nitrosomonas sp.]
MRQVSESIAVATLSGRDLALQRRKVMALHGKTGMTNKKLNQRSVAVHKTSNAASTTSSVDPVFTNFNSASNKHVATVNNGRSVSRARRNAMNQLGKAAVKSTSGKPSGRKRPQSNHDVVSSLPSIANEQSISARSYSCDDGNYGNGKQDSFLTRTAADVVGDVNIASGRSINRARRNAMNQLGKAAIKSTSGSPSERRHSQHHQGNADSMPSAAMTQEVSAKSCGCKECDCNNHKKESSFKQDTYDVGIAQASATAAPKVANVSHKAVDNLSSRAFARARRAALAQDGKAGLKRASQVVKIASSMPDMDWQAAMTKGATGRQVAMQRRLVRSVAGRADVSNKKESRPSGRMRSPQSLLAPPKVEQGHTLSGHEVTGTMVERSKRVTGNEPGSCRAITGTEYIGAEQFNELCPSQPEPAPSKVSVSSTLRSHKITGTELGRSVKVTGDEPGACRNVTGTEYLASERFDEFCPSKPVPAPAKVNVDRTAKEKAVTGTSVVNTQKVTGNEQGADRAITGTNYTQKSKDWAPDKVIVSHTGHDQQVTGTAVGHTTKITGDESGACRNNITGTEYLSAEQFKDICRSEPPTTPHKVSVMTSQGNLPVSGTEVGRSNKVTGDEQGSCRPITGTQYFTASDFGELCNVNWPRKVSSMQTLANGTITGTEVGHSPKMTGDDKGGCKPVTGTDYVGANPEGCTVSTPVAPVAKVFVDQTWRGQPITGSYVGRSRSVTGDEYGDCSPISGTPYIGRNQYSGFCESTALEAQQACLPASTSIPAIAVTGDRPGANGEAMTGDERGICEPITGTPYVGADNIASKCGSSGRFVPRARTFEEPVLPTPPADFSIKPPARQAQERRIANDNITGYVYTDERITGPANKAGGLITGTPEFRHRDSMNLQIKQEEAVAAAHQRLTGEGKQMGTRITGDAWHDQNRVTGTESASSQTRNLSIRGETRGVGTNAQHFREVERIPVPESRITGSAGSATRGAIVTVSGGARA